MEAREAIRIPGYIPVTYSIQVPILSYRYHTKLHVHVPLYFTKDYFNCLLNEKLGDHFTHITIVFIFVRLHTLRNIKPKIIVQVQNFFSWRELDK